VSVAVTKMACGQASLDQQRAHFGVVQGIHRFAGEAGEADMVLRARVEFDHHGNQRAPLAAVQFSHATGARRRGADPGVLLVFEQRLAERHAVARTDQHRGFEAVGVEAERGHARDGRRRLDARRRLSGERKIKPFRALVKARWPSFLMSPYRVHSPGLCVPSTQYRTRCAPPYAPRTGMA
jgi:hypothetical protein